ncbi:MAG: Ornithine cyclodeaminase [Rhodoferax sp.]|nr:Ornithine cyclodeaminase [Rhodoferax sp.]
MIETAMKPISDVPTLLLLDGTDVRALLSHDAALHGVRQAFMAHSSGAGRSFGLVREAIAAGAVFGIKSGEIAGNALLGLKAAGFWPANPGRGLDAHQASILLVDPATGRPRCLMDGNHVTAMRTGAAGGIGIAVLARADSQRLCVFGAGVQARIQIDYALRACPAVRELVYVTADGQANQAFEEQFAARCRVALSTDADTAVASADIVITATPSRLPLFSLDAVRPGTHINAVGADTRGKRELPAGLLERSTLVVVDDRLQAQTVGEGQWVTGCATAEIGELLGQTPAWVRPPAAITVFDLTGLALQDLVVAAALVEAAEARGLGQRLAWPC